jgi:hypothetical protein
MKKIIGLVLTITFLLSSCSSSDDNNSGNNGSEINPPDWIQGTWLLEASNPTTGYRFTNDDFCLIVISQQTCFKESISQTNSSGAITNVDEEISDNSYSIEITLGSQIVTYEFAKISETEIELINDPLGDLVVTIFVKE